MSCSESDDDGPKPIELTGGTETQQTVYADDKAPAPIQFTATAPWTATVSELVTKAAGGSSVDWLTLDNYEGGAGDVSLTMTLSPNLTGTDRKAEIRIACGGTTITITVEQKGTKQDDTEPDPENPENPDKPTPAGYALVERIDARFWIGCEEEAGPNEYRDDFVYEFRYDDRNRIAEYEVSDHDYDDETGVLELDYKCTTRFDYTIQGEIRLTEHTAYGPNSGDDPHTDTYRILLDEQGRAEKITANNESYGNTITYNYSYNDEGRWCRISWYDRSESSTEIYEALTYQNGVLSKVNYHYYADDKKEVVFPADAFGDVPNDRLNIDPNWLIFMEPLEPQEMLPMLRLTGKGCDRQTNWAPYDYDDDNIQAEQDLLPTVADLENRDVTLHKTHDYYLHKKSDPLQYTFNDDGTVASIEQPIVCIKMRHEHDIVVGHELDTEGYGKYKYTIENEKTYEVERSTDKHQWMFTYRK